MCLTDMINSHPGYHGFAISDTGRLIIIFNDPCNPSICVCVEFQGCGIMNIYNTNNRGEKIDDRYEVFDTNSYANYREIKEAFKMLMVSKFGIEIYNPLNP